MTDFGRRSGVGDMLKATYDPNKDGVIALAQTEADMKRSVYDANLDGVIAVAQTEADMTKVVYNPVIAAIQALAAAHKTQHQNGGTDEINATGLTGVPVAPLLVDGTPGRVFRVIQVYILDATTAAMIKANTTSKFNGDAISIQDDISKGATTGHWTLSANGAQLTIENAGLSGSVLWATGALISNYTDIDLLVSVFASGNDIILQFHDLTLFDAQDITTLVDTGSLTVHIAYFTDA